MSEDYENLKKRVQELRQQGDIDVAPSRDMVAKAAADPTTDEAAMNRALAAHADEVLAGEPEYDWGPDGPPK